MPETMIINYVCVDGGEVLVGATNQERWDWELEDGAGGQDAKTLVVASLKDPGRGWAIEETVHLYVATVDPLRPSALAVIPALLEAAWSIRERQLDQPAARHALFGTAVVPAP